MGVVLARKHYLRCQPLPCASKAEELAKKSHRAGDTPVELTDACKIYLD